MVPAQELADLLWDGSPPVSAAGTLRSYLTRLRHAVGPRVAQRILTRDQGYLCRVDTAELDALGFEALCRQGAVALRAGRSAEASQALEQALELWRDEPLLDIPSRLLREQVAPRFEQLRLQALEDRAEVDLALGRHDRLILELRELAAAHPLRERFHAQLMTALDLAGRRAEALETYQQARRALVDELGIEPGAELCTLHARILAGDTARVQVAARPPAGQAPAPTPVAARVPRQLPAAPGHFTGRYAELDLLTGLPDRFYAVTGGTVMVSAADGMAGIGKTAVALHAAHRLSDHFPDGQLFVDLHGYTKGHPPRKPGQALAAFLRVLGVPTGQIPEDTEECAALYRQCLADTRTLVVLDNAADEAQVRPLLPGHPGCLVLVTSRRRLRGLDDACGLSLDLLPPADAVSLLRAVAGPDRIPAEDPLSDEIAQLCGRLPLALRIAGALLRHRPAWTLQRLATLLHDQHRQAQVLSDGERDLGTVFDLSYLALDEQHQRLFRRLGLVPGPDADAHAAAALLMCDPGLAAGLLEDLVDHNLLIACAHGRYRMHDLIRAHARTLADSDPHRLREDALDRLLHYYAHTARTASTPIARNPRAAPHGPAPAHSPVLHDPEVARTWLRIERDNLEAAHTHARTSALHRHALALAAGLAEILLTDGPFTHALDLHQSAATTAQRLGYPAARAAALKDLGVVRRQTGDLSGASDALTQSLETFRAIGDRFGEATALADLGLVRYATGDLPTATDALTEALEIFRAIGHRFGEATALTELGRVRRMTGDLSGATETYTRALEIFRAIGHRLGEAYALEILGEVRQTAGDLSGAAVAVTQALEISRAMGHRHREATALGTLGCIWRMTGDVSAAYDALNRAIEIFRAMGHRANEAWALNHYAATVAAGGDLPGALALYQQSLAMNRELNKPDDEAIALEGLGECLTASGNAEEGIMHLHHALEIAQRLGLRTDVYRIQDRLADLTAR